MKTGINTINVDSAGLHKINIWIREAGFKIDGIYVTAGPETPTDSSIDPSCIGQLMINEVFLDLDSVPNTITIKGENFDNGNAPEVACGGTASPYTATNCLLTGSDQIDCLMPEGILIPGDYNLSVSTGGHPKQYDEYDLTIGTVGPAGLQGEKGNTGDTGPQGIQGIQGEKGDTGEKGDKGDTGSAGPIGPGGVDGGLYSARTGDDHGDDNSIYVMCRTGDILASHYPGSCNFGYILNTWVGVVFSNTFYYSRCDGVFGGSHEPNGEIWGICLEPR